MANIVARILRRTSERKIEDILVDQSGFRRGKGTRNAIRMLRIISNQTLEILWKVSQPRILLVTDFIELMERIPYQWRFCRVWTLTNVRTGNLHCEIYRWLCAIG
jgi:hypothetical protein